MQLRLWHIWQYQLTFLFNFSLMLIWVEYSTAGDAGIIPAYAEKMQTT